MSLTIEKEEIGSVTSFRLIGSLDTNTAGELEAAVKDLLAQSDPALLMDLSGLDYMSSNGLRVIVFTAKSMRSHSDRFVLHSMKPRCKSHFEDGRVPEIPQGRR